MVIFTLFAVSASHCSGQQPNVSPTFWLCWFSRGVGTMPQTPCAPFTALHFSRSTLEPCQARHNTAEEIFFFFFLFAAVAKQLQPGVKKPLCARVGEDGQSAWKGSGWQWRVMDAAQPQSPQRLGGYLLQQMGFCTFSTVIHDWKRGTLCVTGYQRFWCGVTQREDKVATKKQKQKQAGRLYRDKSFQHVTMLDQKRKICIGFWPYYPVLCRHAGNNACISSFWEKRNLFSAFLGLFDITLLGITVMLPYRRWGVCQIIYCTHIVLKTVFSHKNQTVFLLLVLVG